MIFSDDFIDDICKQLLCEGRKCPVCGGPVYAVDIRHFGKCKVCHNLEVSERMSRNREAARLAARLAAGGSDELVSCPDCGVEIGSNDFDIYGGCENCWSAKQSGVDGRSGSVQVVRTTPQSKSYGGDDAVLGADIESIRKLPNPDPLIDDKSMKFNIGGEYSASSQRFRKRKSD